jgi:hypothetical protein
MESPVPGSEHEFVRWKQQGGGQVEGIETAQVVLQNKLGRSLGQFPRYLHYAEGGPLPSYGLGGTLSSR